MSSIKKKYDYVFYIGYASTETLDYLYENNIKFNNKEELLENGINLLTSSPTIQTFKMITSNSELENVYKSRTLRKLLSDYFYHADDIKDGTIDSMDIIDVFMENCLIIRENKIDGKCKLVSESSIYETYDDIVSEFILENFLNGNGNISSVDVESFYTNVKKCLSKFKKGTLSTNYGDIITIELIDDELVMFGGDKKKNKKFGSVLISRIIEGMASVISVETNSKYKDNIIKELYCFNISVENGVEYVSAEDLRCRISTLLVSVEGGEVDGVTTNDFGEMGDYEYTIYCDINGNKTGKILDTEF